MGDLVTFVRWACSGAPSGGGLWAAGFVVRVWAMDIDWAALREYGITEVPERVAQFNAVAAMATWDDEHRAAFARWAQHPFNM